MLTIIISLLVGAHLGAKFPDKATLIVDKATELNKDLVDKVKSLVAKK